ENAFFPLIVTSVRDKINVSEFILSSIKLKLLFYQPLFSYWNGFQQVAKLIAHHNNTFSLGRFIHFISFQKLNVRYKVFESGLSALQICQARHIRWKFFIKKNSSPGICEFYQFAKGVFRDVFVCREKNGLITVAAGNNFLISDSK